MLKVCTCACTGALLVAAVGAQENEAPRPFVYGTYMECDLDRQWRVDEIASTVYLPVFDAAVADGTIGSWGWMAHHTGGEWRRVQYFTAPTLEALLDAQDKVFSAAQDKNGAASREVSSICGAHVDYIWQQVTGSPIRDRGKAGFSVYHVCDQAKEARADELVKTVFAPIYERYVAAGQLKSWSWMEHVVGGEYRRLATMTADDHKALLKVRGEIIDEIYTRHQAEGAEFDSICTMHQDYMWDIQHQKP